MTYKLWLKQDGDGCDYTIGCGNKLLDLKSTDKIEAIKEASEQIGEYSGREDKLIKAYLLELVEDISHICKEKVQESIDKEARLKLEQKREQLKKLKQELGEE